MPLSGWDGISCTAGLGAGSPRYGEDRQRGGCRGRWAAGLGTQEKQQFYGDYFIYSAT